jgi:hypothetical protein
MLACKKTTCSTDKCCGTAYVSIRFIATQEGNESGTMIHVIGQGFHQLKKNLSNIS